jgi:uncharacterized protein
MIRVRVSNVRLSLGESADALPGLVAAKLGVPAGDLGPLRIRRRSLDARRKSNLHYLHTVDVDAPISPDAAASTADVSVVPDVTPAELKPGSHMLNGRPVVIGAGPAGLFAAWQLAEQGYRPVLLERGRAVEKRRIDTASFWKRGELDPESNVLFGEGGAGAFSDGKLTTRIKDPLQQRVLEILVECGAPESTAYEARAHLGTDALPRILRTVRERLTEMGADIRFGVRLDRLVQDHGRITTLDTSDGMVSSNAVIAAIGHSARDTYTMFHESGVTMEPKPFSVGVRVQHWQEIIDRAQYGRERGELDAAEYVLKCSRTRVGRAVYSFCMCPGGTVIPCASEPESLCCNGMSGKSRSGPLANGAIIAQVSADDFPQPGPMGGIEYQRRIERAAFESTGGTYALPYMSLDDLVGGWKTRGSKSDPAMRRFPRAESVDLSLLLPEPVMTAIREASRGFARTIPGWHGSGAVAFGVETRTSAPLRIVRGDDGQSVSTPGLYPAGEGAGYAGGIVSAAVDGMRMARAVIQRFAPPK